MAELAASIIGIATFGLSLTLRLYEFGSTTSAAKSQIDWIASHVSLYSNVLEMLAKRLRDDEAIITEAALRIADRLYEETRHLFARIDGLLPRTDGKKGLLLKHRLAWPFRKKEVDELIAGLDRLRGTLQLLAQVILTGREINALSNTHAPAVVERTAIDRQLLRARTAIIEQDTAACRFAELRHCFADVEQAELLGSGSVDLTQHAPMPRVVFAGTSSVHNVAASLDIEDGVSAVISDPLMISSSTANARVASTDTSSKNEPMEWSTSSSDGQIQRQSYIIQHWREILISLLNKWTSIGDAARLAILEAKGSLHDRIEDEVEQDSDLRTHSHPVQIFPLVVGATAFEGNHGIGNLMGKSGANESQVDLCKFTGQTCSTIAISRTPQRYCTTMDGKNNAHDCAKHLNPLELDLFLHVSLLWKTVYHIQALLKACASLEQDCDASIVRHNTIRPAALKALFKGRSMRSKYRFIRLLELLDCKDEDNWQLWRHEESASTEFRLAIWSISYTDIRLELWRDRWLWLYLPAEVNVKLHHGECWYFPASRTSLYVHPNGQEEWSAPDWAATVMPYSNGSDGCSSSNGWYRDGTFIGTWGFILVDEWAWPQLDEQSTYRDLNLSRDWMCMIVLNEKPFGKSKRKKLSRSPIRLGYKPVGGEDEASSLTVSDEVPFVFVHPVEAQTGDDKRRRDDRSTSTSNNGPSQRRRRSLTTKHKERSRSSDANTDRPLRYSDLVSEDDSSRDSRSSQPSRTTQRKVQATPRRAKEVRDTRLKRRRWIPAEEEKTYQHEPKKSSRRRRRSSERCREDRTDRRQ